MSLARRLPVVATLVAVGVLGCAGPAPSASKAPVPVASPRASADAAPIVATDYGDVGNWAALPNGNPLPVDVFYLYPTVWAKAAPDDPSVNTIDNAMMHEGVPTVVAMQASALAPVGNLYVPYYRQADAADVLTAPQSEQDAIMGGIPTTDATAAFDTYIRLYNGGRPFILLGHSQGSNVLLYLLSGYLRDHPDVQARMVAAYVIGYEVTTDYLVGNPSLRFAEQAADTGVVVSWNTEAPGFTGLNPVVPLPNGLSINPISWTRGPTPAPASASLGSYLPDDTGGLAKVEHYADATVDAARGVVKCSTVDPTTLQSASGVFPAGVLHSGDVGLYYYDLRANAQARADAFLAGWK